MRFALKNTHASSFPLVTICFSPLKLRYPFESPEKKPAVLLTTIKSYVVYQSSKCTTLFAYIICENNWKVVIFFKSPKGEKKKKKKKKAISKMFTM